MSFRYSLAAVDLLRAWEAFVHVGERGSVTRGAAAAGVPQPVASRRIAALERHLGQRLFDRSGRRALLTPVGRDLLPAARRFVRLAAELDRTAEQVARAPVQLALPDGCVLVRLARLVADARDHGLDIEVRTAVPAERAEWVRHRTVGAALLPASSPEAVWRVPLGLATAADPEVAAISVASLRLSRLDRDAPPRRIWLGPEDDLPQLRDPLVRLRDAAGLRPGQVRIAETLPAAVASVLDATDLLLCSFTEADELGLHWRPLVELNLARGFEVAGEHADRIRSMLSAGLARCLGAVDAATARSCRAEPGTAR